MSTSPNTIQFKHFEWSNPFELEVEIPGMTFNTNSVNPVFHQTPHVEGWHNMSEIAETYADELLKKIESNVTFNDVTFRNMFDTPLLTINKKPKMNLSSLAKKFLSSDIRTMVEAGYLDSELDITREGMYFVAEQYLKANLSELAKVAKEDIEEAKKED